MKFKIIKHYNQIGDEYYTIKRKTKPFGIWITQRVRQNYLWEGPIEWLVSSFWLKRRHYEYDIKFDSLDRCQMLIDNTIKISTRSKQFLRDGRFKSKVIDNQSYKRIN